MKGIEISGPSPGLFISWRQDREWLSYQVKRKLGGRLIKNCALFKFGSPPPLFCTLTLYVIRDFYSCLYANTRENLIMHELEETLKARRRRSSTSYAPSSCGNIIASNFHFLIVWIQSSKRTGEDKGRGRGSERIQFLIACWCGLPLITT